MRRPGLRDPGPGQPGRPRPPSLRSGRPAPGPHLWSACDRSPPSAHRSRRSSRASRLVPISSRSPCARMRPKGRPGSVRAASATRSPGGRWSRSSARASRQVRSTSRWTSSRTIRAGRPQRWSSNASRGTAVERIRRLGATIADMDGAVDRLDPVEGRGKVRQEDGGVVVVVVERQPGHGSRLSRCPIGQEEGLPVPRRGHDRDDRGGRLGRQQADEADPLDDPGARRGRHKLGLHQRDRRVEARTVGCLARRFRGPAPGIVFGDRHQTLVRGDDPESGRQHPSMRSTGRSSTRLDAGAAQLRRDEAPQEPPADAGRCRTPG